MYIIICIVDRLLNKQPCRLPTFNRLQDRHFSKMSGTRDTPLFFSTISSSRIPATLNNEPKPYPAYSTNGWHATKLCQTHNTGITHLLHDVKQPGQDFQDNHLNSRSASYTLTTTVPVPDLPVTDSHVVKLSQPWSQVPAPRHPDTSNYVFSRT